jgi:hypothetical protein
LAKVDLLRRWAEMEAAATRGAVCFPRRVAELLGAGLDLRDRHEESEISRPVLTVASGRLENQLSGLIFPPSANAANERLKARTIAIATRPERHQAVATNQEAQTTA